MCCCKEPSVNGTPNAYAWGDRPNHFSTYPVNPPSLREGDTLLYDEPGRCGGLDCHSHHFRLVKHGFYHCVGVRHGGGDQWFTLCVTGDLMVPSLAILDSNARYWLLHTLYSTWRDAKQDGAQSETAKWREAAANKRIKVRKVRGENRVKVWIEPARENNLHNPSENPLTL